MNFFLSLLNAMPGAITQGMLWGIMAIGVYITYRILDVADLTVDGSLATGGAVCVMLMRAGWNPWVALLCAFCRLQVGESFKGAAKFLSSTSFGVYLIHISPFILANYIADSFAFIAGLNAALVIPCELGCAAAIYAVCTLIEFLRQKLFALCGIDRLADIVSRRLDRVAARQ